MGCAELLTVRTIVQHSPKTGQVVVQRCTLLPVPVKHNQVVLQTATEDAAAGAEQRLVG
jgi:hypothetical protein